MPGLLEPFQPVKVLFVRAIGLSLLAWVGVEAWAGRMPRAGALVRSSIAWSFVAVLATVFAISPRLSLLGELTQREGLLTVLALTGLHLAALRSHRGERDVRATLRVVGACALAAAAYAQLQLAGLDPIPWGGLHTYQASGVVALRPAGPLGNPILLGAVLGAALPIALARLAEDTGEPARLVPAAALLAASLVMTLSRGAWVAAAAGAGVALAMAVAAGARPRRVAWTLAASLSPALLFGAIRAWGPLVARLGEGAEGQAGTVRASIARGAVQLWSDRPWLGMGPDAFGLAFVRVQEPVLWRGGWIGLPVHAHSVPLQVLATLGAVGALAGLAWVAAAAGTLRGAWRERPESRPLVAALAGVFTALLAAGAVNVVGPAGAALFAVAAALAGTLRERAAPPGRPVRPTPRAAPAIAATAVCWLVLSAGVPEMGGLALARPVRDELQPAGRDLAERRTRAMAHAEAMQNAVSVWPYDDTLWRLACQASLVEAALVGPVDRRIGAAAEATAETDARHAVSLEPERAEGYASFGDALAARALRTRVASTADSADAAYALASALAPADGWLLVSRARFQLARRDGARALGIAQRIASLYPEAAVGHTLSGAALILLGRPADARAELLAARAARWEEDAGEQRAAVERLLASVSVPPDSSLAAPDPARGPGGPPPRP